MAKNKRYFAVTWIVDATGFCTVEAESEKEAREIASNEYYACSETVEIGDANEISSCVEMTKKEFEDWDRRSNQEVLRK